MSFGRAPEEPSSAAAPELEAPPDLPVGELLDRAMLDWGPQLAAHSIPGRPSSSLAGTLGGRDGGADAGARPSAAAGGLESGMLDMSAFDMGGGGPEAQPSGGAPVSGLESGMLDMAAFGLGGGEPGPGPSSSTAASGLESGVLDMSAFGMGGWDEAGNGGGGGGQGSQAPAVDTGMLDMSAFGMGAWDDAPQSGPDPISAPDQAVPKPQTLTLKKLAAAGFQALSDAELAELRGLLGVPGGPLARPGRFGVAPGVDDEDGEPREDGTAGAAVLGLHLGAVCELGQLAGLVSACGGDPARPAPDLAPLDDPARRALSTLQARRLRHSRYAV